MTTTASDKTDNRGMLRALWRKSSALRTGILAGAIAGAVFGGAGGRIVMRIIALIDTSTDGVRTDSGTVGEFTADGTLGLMQFAVAAGMVGGVLYIAVRRWLPWSGVARGVAFGLFIVFVPGILVFNNDNPDLQIFEPVLPILGMFTLLVVIYGITVALLADRLHAPPAAPRGRHFDAAARVIWCLAAVAMGVIAFFSAMDFMDGAGTCLAADGNGSCAVSATDR